MSAVPAQSWNGVPEKANVGTPELAPCAAWPGETTCPACGLNGIEFGAKRV